MNEKTDWTRAEAERRFREVLDFARTDGPQTIVEDGGEFIVRFVPTPEENESAARILARGRHSYD